VSVYLAVDRAGFNRHMIDAAWRTAFRDAPPFRIQVERRASGGARLIVQDDRGGVCLDALTVPARLETGTREFDRNAARAAIADWYERPLMRDRKHKRVAWEWFRVGAPYCFARLAHRDGEPMLWLPLNRLYKPLGVATEWKWIDYEEHRDNAFALNYDPAEIPDVWHSPCPGERMLWLYNDNPASLRGYFRRLGRLSDAFAVTGAVRRKDSE
jgi:hypothetical protein